MMMSMYDVFKRAFLDALLAEVVAQEGSVVVVLVLVVGDVDDDDPA